MSEWWGVIFLGVVVLLCATMCVLEMRGHDD